MFRKLPSFELQMLTVFPAFHLVSPGYSHPNVAAYIRCKSVTGNLLCFLCRTDDLNLPAVPPIEISVPHNYPFSSPECKTANYSTFVMLVDTDYLI